MADEFEPIQEISKQDLEKAFQEAIEAAERLHQQLASATEKAGYSHQVLVAVYPRYQFLFDKVESDPTLYPVIASGIEYVRNLTEEFHRMSGLSGDVSEILGPVTNSSGTLAGSTGVAFSLSGLQETPGFVSFPADLPRQSTQEYIVHLRAMDLDLARSYDQVWQTYYGTSADRYRGSLFMMRQVYDHFFAHLAPDDLVRSSKYWQPKTGDKPDQIFRSERVVYAAQIHIKDIGVANTLAASAKHINRLYEAANEAHKRGALDEASANKALIAMDNLLKDWLDALE